MDMRIWGPLIGALIGAAAALGGGFMTQHLTRLSQRQHWIKDKKLEEYREFFSVLARAERFVAQLNVPMGVIGPEEKKEGWEAENDMWRVCQDRVFIAGVMQRINVKHRWASIMSCINKRGSRGLADFVSDVGKLRESVMESAYKDLGIGPEKFEFIMPEMSEKQSG